MTWLSKCFLLLGCFCYVTEKKRKERNIFKGHIAEPWARQRNCFESGGRRITSAARAVSGPSGWVLTDLREVQRCYNPSLAVRTQRSGAQDLWCCLYSVFESTTADCCFLCSFWMLRGEVCWVQHKHMYAQATHTYTHTQRRTSENQYCPLNRSVVVAAVWKNAGFECRP